MRDLLSIIDDPILDPLMNSSPIGEGCAELGLPYLGIEADPRHLDTACMRLEAAAERGAGD